MFLLVDVLLCAGCCLLLPVARALLIVMCCVCWIVCCVSVGVLSVVR